jgi:hypothetical protein
MSGESSDLVWVRKEDATCRLHVKATLTGNCCGAIIRRRLISVAMFDRVHAAADAVG